MRIRFGFLMMVIVLCMGSRSFAGTGHEDQAAYKKVDMNINVNKEDKEIGLKRMELLDKMLSR